MNNKINLLNYCNAVKTQSAKDHRRSLAHMLQRGGRVDLSAPDSGYLGTATAEDLKNARACYYWIKEANAARERAFNIEGHAAPGAEHIAEKRARFWWDYEDQAAAKAKQAADAIGLKIYCCTWWHLMDQNGLDVYTRDF